MFRRNLNILFAVILLTTTQLLYSQVSEVTVEVNWVQWSSDNKVEIYDPSGSLIFEVCDPVNCQTTTANSNYSATFNLGCLADLNNYYLIALDAYGDGWNGAGSYVEVTSGGGVAINYNLTAGATSGQQFFNVSGGGACPTSDASVYALTLPSSGCGLTNSESVTVTVGNSGTSSISNVPVQYQINGGGYVAAGTVSGPITAGGTTNYVFNLDLSSEGTYDIDVRTQLSGDGNSANDESTGNIVVHGDVHNFVSGGTYTMGFETGDDVSGWLTLNENSDGGIWVLDGTDNPRTGTQAAKYNYNVTNAADDWMFTKCLDLEAGSTYEIEYYYRVRSATYPESFALRVTSAQTSSSTVSTIETLNNLTNTTYTQSLNTFTVGSNGTYYIAWEATSAADRWDFYIDDIVIRKVAAIDAGITAINPPASTCGLTASETVQATIENFGTSSISNVPIEYRIDGGSYQSGGTYAPTIASGATANINFTADLSGAGTHTIDVRTALSGDEISGNDELAGATVDNQSIDLTLGGYTMGFETTEDFSGWVVLNANGDNRQWESTTNNPNTGSRSYRVRNTNSVANDWLFTPCVYLEAGETYSVDFARRARNVNFSENMSVLITSAQDASSTVSTIATYTGFNYTAYVDESEEFTVGSSGTYYIAWRATSAASQRGMHVDDVNIYNTKFYWLGNSTTWADANNWSRDAIPTSSDDVVIPENPVGGSLPLLVDTAYTSDFTMEGSVTISFTSGSAIAIAGDFTGSISSSIGGVVFNGSAAQSINGSNKFNDLEIDNSAGVTITSDNQELRGVLLLNDGVLDLNGNVFTLISDASGDASIGEVVNGDISGDITVERYIDEGETNWRFMASPIKDADLEQWDDDFITSGYPGSDYPSYYFPSVYSYNESVSGDLNNGFEIPTTGSMPLNNGEGYWVWCGDSLEGTAPFTVIVTGEAAIGDVTMNTSYTNSGDTNNDGWTMAGNPYASEIDWDAAGWTKTNMNDAIYIYDPDAQAFKSYVDQVGALGGTQYIPSGQAFWVQANGAGPSLIARESVKTNTGEEFTKPGSRKGQLLRLEVKNSESRDDFVIRFFEGASNGFDRMYDAQKFDNYGANFINASSLDTDSLLYAINSFPVIDTSTSIPIVIDVAQSGVYEFQITELFGFSNTSCLTLEDLLTGDIYPLSLNQQHQFELEANVTEPRFVIHSSAEVVKEVSDAICHGEDNGSVEFSVGDLNDRTYTLYQTSQDTIEVTSVSSGETAKFTGLTAGPYFVTIESSGKCPVLRDSFRVDEPVAVTSQFESKLRVDAGELISFTNSSLGASSYVWSFEDGQSSTLRHPQHTFNQPGLYQVTLISSNDNDCTSETKRNIRVDGATGVDINKGQSDVAVFMSGNTVNIDFKFLESTEVGMSIYAINGQLIKKPSSINVKEGVHRIEMNYHAAGIYMLEIEYHGITKTFKLYKT